MRIHLSLIGAAAVIAAGVLCFFDKSGWGWFVFIALICTAAECKN